MVVAAVLVAIVVAAAVLTAASRLVVLAFASVAGRPSQVTFDDRFNADRGWDMTQWEGDSDVAATRTAGGLRLTSNRSSDAHDFWHPGPSVEHPKIAATMTQLRGDTQDTDFGLVCVQPGGDQPGELGYAFWAGSDGTAVIEVDHGQATQLAAVGVSRWHQGDTHTLTAVCYSDFLTTHLELLVDGHSVVTATDRTYRARFLPAIMLDGNGQVDVHRFTVSTIS
jgi:hypothetical protein